MHEKTWTKKTSWNLDYRGIPFLSFPLRYFNQHYTKLLTIEIIEQGRQPDYDS